MGPITGNDLRNRTIVPKKSPKRNKIPTDSTANPMKERFIKMRMMPPKKKSVGFILVGRAKKYMVRAGPMISTTPIINKMFPIASKSESKNVNIPRMKKTTPAAVDATPYSAMLVKSISARKETIFSQ
ncbi:hypothetical protein JCM33374_g957 [Metschnikowia sp. JCM 33374]|nr:hypothetical protein JCM33374_g957 [Metschnikowia sp. JCM 33374]